MELDKTLRQGSCVWRAGRNLGAGDGWRGRVNLVMRGVGSRGEEPSECGEPGTLGVLREVGVWNLRVLELCGIVVGTPADGLDRVGG